MKRIILFLVLMTCGCAGKSGCCTICAANSYAASGSGPAKGGTLETAIIVTAAIVVIVTLILNIKYILFPKETRFDEIKKITIDEIA